MGCGRSWPPWIGGRGHDSSRRFGDHGRNRARKAGVFGPPPYAVTAALHFLTKSRVKATLYAESSRQPGIRRSRTLESKEANLGASAAA